MKLKYTYRAKKGVETVEGVIAAESQVQAISKLEEMGYFPVRVEEEHRAREIKRGPLKGIRLPQRIHSKQVNLLTRQLASLLKSKVPLVQALNILARETREFMMKELIEDLRDKVKEGKQLSQALALYPKYFSKIYINMVASGEKGGMLDRVLMTLSEFAERQEEIKSKVRSALAYPLLIAVMGCLTVFVLVTFVLPRLAHLFSEMGQELPWMTRMLISVSHFAETYWVLILGAVAALAVVIQRSRLLEKNRMWIDQMVFRIPLLRQLILEREIARFARILALLVSHGIPIRDAIDAAVATLGNKALEQDLRSVSESIASGLSVGRSLARVALFPGYVTALIEVGEQGGRLHETLLEVAVSYERDLDEKMKVASSLIEPLIILAIGLVVGCMVMAMLLPIFEMSFK